MKEPENSTIALELEQILEELPLPEFAFLQMQHEVQEDDKVHVRFYIRTTSWDPCLPGDRTDANDLLSVVFGLFLRAGPTRWSVKLWDVPHPAIPHIEGEIYARYATLEQPDGSIFTTDPQSLKEYEELIVALTVFHAWIPKVFSFSPRKESSIDYQCDDILRWLAQINKLVGEKDPAKPHFLRRTCPNWKYYRNESKGISIFRTRRLTKVIRALIQTTIADQTELKGVNRDLVNAHGLLFSPPRHLLSKARKILRGLGDAFPEANPPSCCYENRVIFVGTCHTVIYECDSGHRQYQLERQRVWERHRQEESILFPATSYDWNIQIDDERFELLLRDLIAVEPGVRRVRKSGHSRDSDAGVDLIADWMTPKKPDDIEDQKSILTLRRIVVQAKVSTKGIGKNKVMDIRDTVENAQAEGFLLVVSSWITSDLMDHLEKIRIKSNLWIDWWTRPEIEDRLDANLAIVNRYADIVTRVPGNNP